LIRDLLNPPYRKPIPGEDSITPFPKSLRHVVKSRPRPGFPRQSQHRPQASNESSDGLGADLDTSKPTHDEPTLSVSHHGSGAFKDPPVNLAFVWHRPTQIKTLITVVTWERRTIRLKSREWFMTRGLQLPKMRGTKTALQSSLVPPGVKSTHLRLNRVPSP